MLCGVGLFLVKASDYRVYYRVKSSGGGVFSFETMLVRALGKVGFDDGVYDGFEDFGYW